MRHLEDLSAAELERLFPPRRPAPKPVPHATEPVALAAPTVAVPRLMPDAKPVVRRPRARAQPPVFDVDRRRCQTCRRPWVETPEAASTACPFCGAER